MPADLDQSGNSYQRVRAYLGPSLGWVEVQVQPEVKITSGGTFTVQFGNYVILVDVNAPVTIQLPDVRVWVSQNFYQPASGFERAIWIKDLGGNASLQNITVTPFSTQTIDKLAQSFTILQSRQLLRLYPLNDMT